MKRILSFILIFILTFSLIPFSSYASSDSNSEESESSWWTECKNWFGLTCAQLGYSIEEQTINGNDMSLISKCLEGVADYCMTDAQKKQLSTQHGYDDWATMQEDDSKDWSEVYWEAILEQELIINDTQAKQLKVSQSVVDAINSFMSSDSMTDNYDFFMINTLKPADISSGILSTWKRQCLADEAKKLSETDVLLFSVYTTNQQCYVKKYSLSDNFITVNPDNTLTNSLSAFKTSATGINYYMTTSKIEFPKQEYIKSYIVNKDSYNQIDSSSMPNVTYFNHYNNKVYYSEFISWGANPYYCESDGNRALSLVTLSGNKVPVFKNIQSYFDYCSGNSPIYIYDSDYSGGELVVSTDLDYNALNDAIRKGIKDADIISALDVQRVINTTVTEWLKKIEDNTDDIADNTKETNSILRNILNDMKSGFDKSLDKLKDINTSVQNVKDSLSDILKYLKSGNFGSGNTGLTPEDSPDSILNLEIPIDFTVSIGTDADGNEIFEQTTSTQTLAKWIDEISATKFPFSSFHNMKMIYECFVSEPAAAPKLRIQLSGTPPDSSDDVILLSSDNNGSDSVSSNASLYSLGNVGFDIDFTYIDPIMPFIRGIEIILFSLMLIGLTMKFVSFMGDML